MNHCQATFEALRGRRLKLCFFPVASDLNVETKGGRQFPLIWMGYFEWGSGCWCFIQDIMTAPTARATCVVSTTCWNQDMHTRRLRQIPGSPAPGSACIDIQQTRLTCVVISQTRWLVSQERLSLRAGTSVFILYNHVIWWVVVLNSQLVCHTTLLPQ